MSSNERIQESVWECRKTKIELQHEVLLREMEATLVAEVGLLISGLPAILLAKLDTSMAVIAISFLGIGVVLLDILRLDRKEKIIAKEGELDSLIREISTFTDQDSRSR